MAKPKSAAKGGGGFPWYLFKVSAANVIILSHIAANATEYTLTQWCAHHHCFLRSWNLATATGVGYAGLCARPSQGAHLFYREARGGRRQPRRFSYAVRFPTSRERALRERIVAPPVARRVPQEETLAHEIETELSRRSSHFRRQTEHNGEKSARTVRINNVRAARRAQASVSSIRCDVRDGGGREHDSQVRCQAAHRASVRHNATKLCEAAVRGSSVTQRAARRRVAANLHTLGPHNTAPLAPPVLLPLPCYRHCIRAPILIGMDALA
eukprot:SAG11_NODE_1728_length_4367_cov_4.915183_4_plen_269_part_00